MDMYLSKFHIYQCRVAPYCFKSHTSSWCPDFVQKKEKFCLMSGLKLALSEVTSFLPNNVSWLKKIIFRRGLIFFSRVTKLFVLPRSMFSYIMVFGLPYLFSQYLFNYFFRDFIKGSFSFILCSSFRCFLL